MSAGVNHCALLTGVHVVNVGVNIPAPVTAARLRAMGAEVTKVEPPAGDPLKVAASGWYEELAHGQEVVTLDLKDDEGQRELMRLLAVSDLLLTSSRPSTLARLSLNWPQLEASFPRLLQVAIVGHGDGRQEVPGHDLNYVAPYGLLNPPTLPRTLVADIGGAERAVTAALGLLFGRERGSATRYVEVALADAAVAFAAPWTHDLTRDGGVLGGDFPFYRLYEAKGGWIALGALELRFQERLASALALDSADASALEKTFRSRTPFEWQAWAEETGVPLTAVSAGDAPVNWAGAFLPAAEAG